MMFCPECGADHHADEREAEAEVKRATDAEVEIERLRTKRDIEVARINAGAATDIAESEAEQETVRSEGIVQGIETVVDAVTPDAPEPAAEPGPVVVDVSGTEPVTVPDDAPPKVDESGHHEPPAPERKRGFF